MGDKLSCDCCVTGDRDECDRVNMDTPSKQRRRSHERQKEKLSNQKKQHIQNVDDDIKVQQPIDADAQNQTPSAHSTKKRPSVKQNMFVTYNNNKLRTKSLSLVTPKFIKFVKKSLATQKVVDKMWAQCDPSDTGIIDTPRFIRYFWSIIVKIYKIQLHREKSGSVTNIPQFNSKELKKEYKHLSIWIVLEYGIKQNTGAYQFEIKKDNDTYKRLILEYLTQYMQSKGVLSVDK